MNTTMLQSVMLSVLIHIFLVFHGAVCSEPEAEPGVVDLPWRDQLCCDSPADATHTPGINRSEPDLPTRPRCSFRSLTTASRPHNPSGVCVDLLCRIDENWEDLRCDVQRHSSRDAGLMAVSFQRMVNVASPDPVLCEAEDSFVCSVALGAMATSSVTTVTVSISDAVATPVPLRVPARPVKPAPPINLSHTQTIEPALVLDWDDPEGSGSGRLRYEVRFSSNTTHPAWQVLSAPRESRIHLDLKPRLNYTVQVHSSGLEEPPLWSDWSEPHRIYLDTVSYIPEKVVARPDENVTIYCVFNDHSVDADSAMWILNLEKPLHHSQYRPVNQWVSQLTLHPSETRMYDLLQCMQWTIPYSQVYIEGAFIDINCVTNGDIDAMECSWDTTQMTETKFRSRWADLTCDQMEKMELEGEEVGEPGPIFDCKQIRLPNDLKRWRTTCTIKPVRMNCYKLWVEVNHQGPVRSRPVYLTPIDHVKPYTPMNVKAVSDSNNTLMVTWQPPFLPAELLQCQIRHYSLSTVRTHPEWKIQDPVRVPVLEVTVPDMCSVYVVQGRCKRANGKSYWSDWSDSVYSTPQNSRAPEHGPDFWRILQETPDRNRTNVTLLFQRLPTSRPFYCVNKFIVQHQTSSGAVTRETIDPGSSYSFDWNQEPQTVTVEAFNDLGSSANNIKMSLERQAKRRCVRSFRVLIINSTCVSLSWTLMDNSSVPMSMVVQWSPQRHQNQDQDHHRGLNGETWTRIPYTDRAVYLKGDFFDSEEYGFYLYPVFSEGEGEPVYTVATRGDPAAYMMLMIIAFLFIVLIVTLVLSQNQMKKFVWKDVPDPYKCSWAKGLDFKKADAFDHLFQPPDGLPAWPLLLPNENISKVAIVDKADLAALTTALVQAPLPSLTFDPEFCQTRPADGAPFSAIDMDALTASSLGTDELQLDDLPQDGHRNSGSSGGSAHSGITYATVLLADGKQEQPPVQLRYKGGGGSSSSSDEGNFSANNSDISGSFPGGLLELDDPRRSCSYNSVEELSETSDQEEDEAAREGKCLYYLGADYQAEDEDSEGERRELKNAVLDRESHPLLRPADSVEEPLFVPVPLYMPQFRTAPCTRQVAD